MIIEEHVWYIKQVKYDIQIFEHVINVKRTNFRTFTKNKKKTFWLKLLLYVNRGLKYVSISTMFVFRQINMSFIRMYRVFRKHCVFTQFTSTPPSPIYASVHTRFKSTKLPFTRICKLLIRPPSYVKFVLIRVASNWCSVQLRPYSSLFGPNRLPGHRNECDMSYRPR